MLLSAVAVFVLQGSPGLPSLAALQSNQILTVKVCPVDLSSDLPNRFSLHFPPLPPPPLHAAPASDLRPLAPAQMVFPKINHGFLSADQQLIKRRLIKVEAVSCLRVT